MKKTFRDHHLLKALTSFDLHRGPLDLHVGNYFRNNKSLGANDRRAIASKMYSLIRWLSLVDHHCEDGHSWDERLDALSRIDLKKKVTDISIPLHIRASFPKPLFTILADHYGEEKALSLCLSSNTEAPITLRANLAKTTRAKLIKVLEKEKLISEPTPESPWGIRMAKRSNLTALPAFKEGHFEIQDEASQLVAHLVEAKPGDHVLDYCAGSGGKALAFAFKLQGKGQIYIHDIRPTILQQAKKRLKRAGVQNATFVQPDSKNKLRMKGKMDWVLVDAPCSGTGTYRRNPDLKWKFTPEMLERLCQEQREIFAEALTFLKPGGKIVYATCSILSQENEEQVAFFSRTHPITLSKPPFATHPEEGGMDGFFAAVWTNSSH